MAVEQGRHIIDDQSATDGEVGVVSATGLQPSSAARQRRYAATTAAEAASSSDGLGTVRDPP